RAAQAKRQRANGGSGFGSGYMDGPIDKLTDPDFELADSTIDSDNENLASSFAFSLVEVPEKADEDSEGEYGSEDEYAVHKYNSHRRVPANIMMDLDILQNPL
ncbi:hypothetical protein C0993_002502, partial [Termitomyces sp. T159_Od127]